MADPINLRQARKRKRRAEKQRYAVEARALHGQPGGAKASFRQNSVLEGKRLEAHRREVGEVDGKDSGIKDA